MGQCAQVSKQRKSLSASTAGQGLLAPSPANVTLVSPQTGRGGEVGDKAGPADRESLRPTARGEPGRAWGPLLATAGASVSTGGLYPSLSSARPAQKPAGAAWRRGRPPPLISAP